MSKNKDSLFSKARRLFILLVVIPTFVCGVLLWNNIYSQAVHQEETATHSLMQAYIRSLESQLSRAGEATRILSTNLSVQNLLSSKNGTDGHTIIMLAYDAGDAVISCQSMLNDMNAMVTVYTDDAILEKWLYFLHVNRLKNDESYNRFLSKNTVFSWEGVDWMYPDLMPYFPQNQKVITSYCKILSGMNRTLGVIKCGIPVENIFADMLPIQDGKEMFLLKEGKVLWQSSTSVPKDELLRFETRWDGDTLYVYDQVDSLDATLCICSDGSSVLHRSRQAAVLQIALLVCMAGLVLMITTMFYRSLMRGLREASVLNEHVSARDFSIRFAVKKNDEVGQLLSACNELLDNMEQSTKAKIIEEKNKKEAQIRALQYQINPHFLFNTMNWIQMMAESENGDRKQISETVAQLSDYLRYNMNLSTMSSLSQEQENMESYISIMRVRKGTDILLSTDWDESLDDMPVLRFIFQPLIENAVKHGYIPGRTLRINVSVTNDNEEVHICVSNDGTPIPQDQLIKLTEQFKNTDHQLQIGLANVAARLRLQYGDSARMTVNSTEMSTQFDIYFKNENSKGATNEHLGC